MSTTITDGTTTVTPNLVVGYDATYNSQNVLHDVLGASSPSYGLEPDSLRTGSIALQFLTAALAFAAATMLRNGKQYTLASTSITQIGMKFIRDGGLEVQLDQDSFTWTLTVGFAEVV